MKTTYFVRHGETRFNQEKRLQGWRDSPLSDRGREQVRIVAQLLKPLGLSRAWISPLGRALETAEILQRELNLSLETLSALREVSFGDFEGFTLPEIDRLFPGLWQTRQANKWSYRPPGGESNQEATPRAVEVANRIDSLPDQEPILIIAHFAINRLILAALAGLTPDETMNQNVPHDVVYRAQKQDCKWQIAYLSSSESQKGFQSNWLLQIQPENLPMGG
jgi:broad specificity phosphatase PhoE